ncbi:MAG: TetR family transcriptional regulator [Treponema sp.]|jgi:AcrR family transcriptional regulator|nr:TetR family transcriptional regulator [Treponema sp.]
MKTEKILEKSEISRERIVEAAIALLNRQGIEKLTMRGLAGSLNIKAASLYWHIKDKQDLYDAIAEKMSSEIKPSCGLKDARAYLLEAAALYRKKLLEVRDSVEIFMHSAPVTPQRIELIKNIVICLLHLGIKEENCLIAGHLFNNYILSFTADEVIVQTEHKDAPNPFAGILGTGYKPLNRDKQFLRGLEVLFAGFKILE